MFRKRFQKNKIWFAGCTHFGHTNVIKFDNRPFNNIIEHDEQIIKNINSKVKDDDVIYFMGDFTFNRDISIVQKLINSINGKKYLIFGNHDQIIEENHQLQRLFINCAYYDEILIDEQLCILSHYPFSTWVRSNYNSWMIHSHIHGNKHEYYPNTLKIADVGIMNNNYFPFSYKDIEIKMKDKMAETFS